jgi:hypothetical protein
VLVFFAVWVNTFFVLAKGLTKRICPNKNTTWDCEKGKVKWQVALWMSFATAVVVGILLTPLYFKIAGWASEFVQAQHALKEKEMEEAKSKTGKTGETAFNGEDDNGVTLNPIDVSATSVFDLFAS